MDEPGYTARQRYEAQFNHPHAAYAQPGVIPDKDLLREQARRFPVDSADLEQAS